ncbi:hypothetical protein DFH28DRAFT_1126264 [Melampsora americana]|nr:hypothetical protein DFH28DRAFT_1126264 [Melampsora americana]
MFPSYFASPSSRRYHQTPTFFGDQFDTPSYSICPEHNSFSLPLNHYPYHQSTPTQHPYPSYYDPYNPEADRLARAAQLRRQRLERERELEQEAKFQRELSRVKHHPTHYNDALRTERARRLAAAQEQHRAQRQTTASTDPSDPQVQVTLPDGRRCVVPLSWAKRMQAKHPSILLDNMITKIRQRSPSPPPEHDLVLAETDDESESHDSDFYALDRSQEPYPPVLRPSTVPVEPSPPPFSLPTHRSRDELDEAARVIQKHVRLHLRLKHLKALQTKFHDLRKGFIEPSLLEFQFSEPPTPDSALDSPSKLAFNSSVNKPLQMYEEILLKLQIELDGIVSGGEHKIKMFRKKVVQEVESELERLDRLKIEAWNAQREQKISEAQQGEAEIPTVEMLDADSQIPLEDLNASSEPTELVQDENEMTTADVTSVMSDVASDEQSYQSSIFDESDSPSPSIHEDSPMTLEDEMSKPNSPMILFEESRVPTPVKILEDVFIPDIKQDMDNLVIPNSDLSPQSRTYEPQHDDVILNQDDIILPLRETKSCETLLIPNPIPS